MNCFLCDEIESGRLRARVVMKLNDYWATCCRCGGSVYQAETVGYYLGQDVNHQHVFYILPMGYHCNSCGVLLRDARILCGEYGIDVTNEFSMIKENK